MSKLIKAAGTKYSQKSRVLHEITPSVNVAAVSAHIEADESITNVKFDFEAEANLVREKTRLEILKNYSSVIDQKVTEDVSKIQIAYDEKNELLDDKMAILGRLTDELYELRRSIESSVEKFAVDVSIEAIQVLTKKPSVAKSSVLLEVKNIVSRDLDDSILIKVSSFDYEFIREYIATLPQERKINLSQEDGLSLGDCIIEVGHTIYDQSLETKFEQMNSALLNGSKVKDSASR